ncbi:MAG: RNA polymerase sigma factor [Phycisphaerales bacterium]|nr:MAG: RNA polymerase sigma factor [Phycisphaerales bacterium]
MTEDTDANLVAAALKGDAESFSRLCGQYYPALVAIAYTQLTDRNLAEDAAQEALLAAYRDIARLKQPDRFAKWLTAICRNIAIDMARARAREKHAESVDCSPPGSLSRHESDAVALVREILLRLEPTMRDIIYLRYHSRMSYGRIAQMLGISEEAVNGRLRRARDRIRQELRRQAATETKP